MSLNRSGHLAGCCVVVMAAAFDSVAVAQAVVFQTDFDAGVASEIDPGAAAAEGVQGYAGLGHPGNQFGGLFLRSPTGNVVTLTLDGLPAHDAVSVRFLFAAIDSLDGTGVFPEGDFLRVTVDGTQVFRESFANATASQDQSYVPPPGGELAHRVNLGFTQGSFYLDSAYDLGLDPVFIDIPHAGPTMTITWEIEGPGIQPLADESWAMDRLEVSVRTLCPADLAAPFGVLNFFDVSAFIAFYNAQDPRADFAAPFGVFNFFDVSAFIGAYNAGCP